ncbi:MAG TPA: hypothetical protein VMM77_11075 [Gemmatimonadaceae bacterium]|nr:hypothetical protein [Gemmatimonadaceae bacterium]
MREFLLKPVFQVGDDSYCWADVALAAVVWGDWDRLRRETREGLACLRSYRDTGRPLPEAEIDGAAADFRYERELISAQEAEEWFARWGMSAREWMEYIRRSVLRVRLGSRLPEVLARHPVSDDDVAAVAGVEAICSGLLTRLAPKVAARAAAHEQLRGAHQNGGPLHTDEEVAAMVGGFPGDVKSLGLDLDDDTLAASARRLARLELSLRDFRTAVVTPRAVADQISSHHLDWIRVTYQTLIYPAESMAREALLCVREDGMDFPDLAASTAVGDLRYEEHWIGEMSGPLHAGLLGARAGEVLGPFPINGGHALLRLTDKRLPSPEDEQVRSRAETAALQRALSNELQSRVHWLTAL